ncbi:MAG: hypothetical protein FJY07_13550, partial [Bacteroidetes bacterium]|nr:hypothetical protein [Bacteroidota bacterium]
MKKMIESLFIAVLAYAVIFSSCNTGKTKKLPVINPEFSSYVSSFTSGVISVKSDIKIRFTQELNLPGMEPGSELDIDLIGLSPKVKGKVIFEDRHLLIFRPEEPMQQDTRYDVSVALFKLFEVPDPMKYFKFGFTTIKQSFRVTRLDFGPYGNKVLQKNKLNGYIITADLMAEEDVKKLFSAKQNGSELPVRWEYTGDANKYPFVVDSITRSESGSQVILEWNGNPLGIDIRGSETLMIPALGDFSVMEIKVVQQPSQSFFVQFSDPLEEGQNLDGLIRLEKDSDLKFEI